VSEILFNSEEIDFSLTYPNIIIDWITETIVKEGALVGEISYIFCNDNYLHKINMEHLHHDTFTDIITFDYTEGKTLNSDIFISLERVKENANTYNTSFENELHRVIIHGVLHLLRYNDKTEAEIKLMRVKEDFYLSLLSI